MGANLKASFLTDLTFSLCGYKISLFNILFVISGLAFVTFDLSLSWDWVIRVILATLFLSYLTIKFKYLSQKFKEIGFKIKTVGFIATAFICEQNGMRLYHLLTGTPRLYNFLERHNSLFLFELFSFVVTIASFWFIYVLLNLFYNQIIKTLHNCRINRHDILLLLSYVVLFTVFVTWCFSHSNAFFNNPKQMYNVIYSSDSSVIVGENAYFNITHEQNDIRNPLFVVFAIPFSSIAMIFSTVLFFIPNSYAVIIAIFQVILLGVSIFLLNRMISRNTITGYLFFVFTSFTYPFLLFSVMMEQYVFALFYLTMFLYATFHKESGVDFYFVSASGSLLLSAVLFPLITKITDFKIAAQRYITIGIEFIGALVLFNRLSNLTTAVGQVQFLMRYTGIGISIQSRLMQYINFVSGCFFAPSAAVKLIHEGHISYQLLPVTSINWLGICILIVSIFGFILNKKSILARVCLGWEVFSFFILCLVGWGTQENGLILYSLYFGWAFIVLVFMAINSILDRIHMIKFRIIVFCAISLVFLFINAIGMHDLIKFAVTYYPL